jgi:hypothetical protein
MQKLDTCPTCKAVRRVFSLATLNSNTVVNEAFFFKREDMQQKNGKKWVASTINRYSKAEIALDEGNVG